ncbi:MULTISPECIES: acyltransferase family protein [unclassified Curtobacterium]|uniref:acyltransferase family protein n=1 Tax=unclassified Curtobacterium TaxID=257496 RepID=UPI003A7FE893
MHTKRRDIQGLRALAITAVVLEHVFGSPVGGFLGVDVFFVVSGFLITRSLLDMISRTGRVDLRAFWTRRALRLAPAFVVVAATTATVFVVCFPSADPRSVLEPLAAASVSMSNWWFVHEGTDYFGAHAAVSPFLHTWSLAVEEQFYVVWPALIALTLWLLRRRSAAGRGAGWSEPVPPRGTERRARLGMLVVLGLVVCASIAAAALAGTGDAGYFSTVTRAWELAMGAVVAVGLVGTARPSWRIGLPVTVLGIVLIVASVVLVGSDAGVPFPGAVPAVLGTAMVLVGGGSPAGGTIVLENPVSDWLGGISYSLYLWHFPVLVFVGAVAPDATWTAVPVALAAAQLSTHAIERPFLTRDRSSSGAWWVRRIRTGTTVLVVCTTAALTAAAVVPATPVPSAAVADAPPNGALPHVAADRGELAEALRADSWSTALTHRGTPTDSATAPRPCGVIGTSRTEESCTFGPTDAPHTAVLVGDSVAGAWSEALVEWMRTDRPGWRLVVLARNGCPFITTDVQPGVPCAELQQGVVDRIDELSPDAVIVATRFDGIPFERADGGGTLTPTEFEHASAAMIDRVAARTPVVVQLAAPPAGADPSRCHLRFGTPRSCIRPVSDEWRSRMASTERVATAHGVRLVDTSPLVAVDGRTPATIGGELLRIDGVHLTPSASTAAAPALGELITAAGGLER